MDTVDEFYDYNISSIVMDAHSHRAISIWYFLREIITFSISVVSVTCNIFIVYASLKLKKLGTPKHFYLVSSSAMNLLALILSPYVEFLALNLMRSTTDLAAYICCTIHIEKVFMCFNCAFLVSLLSDWFLHNLVNESTLLRYTENFRILAISLHVIMGAALLYDIASCAQDWRRIHHNVVDILYMFLILYALIMNSVRLYLERVKYLRLEFDFSLLIPSMSAAFILPYFLVHYLVKLVHMTEFVGQLCYVIAEGLFYSNAIVNVCILSKLENEYREQFLNILECRCRDNEEDIRDETMVNGKLETVEESC